MNSSCVGDGNTNSDGYMHNSQIINDSEVIVIEQLKNIDMLSCSQSSLEFDENQRQQCDEDDEEDELSDLASENDASEKKLEHWTDFFPGCVEGYSGSPELGGLLIKKMQIEESGQVLEECICYSNEHVQLVAASSCGRVSLYQILVYDAQGDFQILQVDIQDSPAIIQLAKFEGLYKYLNKDVQNVIFSRNANTSNNTSDNIDSENMDTACNHGTDNDDDDDIVNNIVSASSNNCNEVININNITSSIFQYGNSDGKAESFVLVIVSCDGQVHKIQYNKLQESQETQCWQIINNQKEQDEEQKQSKDPQNRYQKNKRNVQESIIGTGFYRTDDVQPIILTNKKMVRLK
eukprot:TRINITY_DN20258_c0_g1_i1.p1 TRINITY_DN20258_c0_g1~~TRINITY_DN20258_c0_g1_i1.p1  ORF type:complete len:393 (-),score=33.51 TRINITY_DN20258_c0_g1_i1:236-1282(-)